MARSPVLSRQPLKAAYLVFFLLAFLVQIPFWFLKFLSSTRRPRPAWTIKRAMIVRAFQELFTIKVDIHRKGRDPMEEVPDSSLTDAKFVWIPPISDKESEESGLLCGELWRLAAVTGVRPARIAGYWLLKKGSRWEGEKAKPGEKTVMHLHGGAFHIGSAHPTDTTANFTRGILEHTETVMRTFAVDYRLTASAPRPPTNPFPAAVLDALAGYRYLVQVAGFAPENIIIAGDSAGGNLAFALVRHLVENAAACATEGLRAPGRMLSVSGWFDPSMSRAGPESSMQRNAHSDMFMVKLPEGELLGAYGITSIRGPLDFDWLKTNRYISPASTECSVENGVQGTEGLFAGFPKAYVIAGGAERLLDDSKVVIERMRADGVDVTEDIPPDAIHDALVFTWHEPERTDVLGRAAKWIDDM